jgi:hypothetical protein
VALAVHRGDELLQEIARLGLRFEVVEQQRGYFAERLLVGDAFARALGDLFPTAGQILFEGLGVARELGA